MLPLHSTIKGISFAFIFSIVFISCSTHSKQDAEIIKMLNEGIENSNREIKAESTDALSSLQSKIYERGSEERAKVWFPKAEKIQQLSMDIFDYIESIKLKIKNTPINSSELFEKLKKYQREVLQVDPKVKDQFQQSLKIFTQTIDSSKNNQEKLFEDYFKNTSSETGIAILNKIQNNIRINELRLVTFCNEQVGLLILDYGYGIASVVLANSMVLEPKGTIEITAGILVFEKRVDNKVFIYDKEINTEDDGYAHHKMRVPSKPGKYYVPVKINYTDQNGRQQSIQKEIEYTVANIQKQ